MNYSLFVNCGRWRMPILRPRHIASSRNATIYVWWLDAWNAASPGAGPANERNNYYKNVFTLGVFIDSASVHFIFNTSKYTNGRPMTVKLLFLPTAKAATEFIFKYLSRRSETYCISVLKRAGQLCSSSRAFDDMTMSCVSGLSQGDRVT